MSKFPNSLFQVSASLLLLVTLVNSLSVPNPKHRNNIRVAEDISGDGRYLAEWVVDFDTNEITFTVEVATLGFVGFGISPAGGMKDADIFIGGFKDGDGYGQDYFGVGSTLPVVDTVQDWKLLEASETNNHTLLKFSRLLDTCDEEQDVAITPNTVRLIWSFGNTDEIDGHTPETRGFYQVNLLDPQMPPVDTDQFENWSLVRTMTMPSAKTSYWCSMHKSPENYTQPRHVIGFNTKLDSPESLAYTHHLNVYLCTAPPDQNADHIFGPFVGQPGNECYTPYEDGLIPTDLCRTMLYVWAVGGKPMFFPEDVGYPINENGGTEYLMYEIHYDNPEELPGVSFTSTVEIFNTQELRPKHAAVLIASHSITFSHVIPPNTKNFVSISHCGPECTGRKLKPEGIRFVNVMLHSHLLGRKMKLRHFREGVELPWITMDDNYDFDYQQNRPLREETHVLPRDQLTMECTTDSTEIAGITMGGLSTHAEMCQGIIWYYPRDDLRFCESAYPEYKVMERFGIQDLSWDNILEPPIILAPPEIENLTFIEAVDTTYTWTPELIAEFQQEVRYTEHYEVSCGLTPIPEDEKFNHFRVRDDILIGYPEIDEPYAPKDTCVASTGAPTTPVETTTGAADPGETTTEATPASSQPTTDESPVSTDSTTEGSATLAKSNIFVVLTVTITSVYLLIV